MSTKKYSIAEVNYFERNHLDVVREEAVLSDCDTEEGWTDENILSFVT